MRKAMRSLVLVSILVASCLGTAAAVVIETGHGSVKGVASDGIVSFKGVPYAQPPVGPLRWRPPQSLAKWSGVLDATRFAPDCYQILRADRPSSNPVSEDCLYLNIWMPEARAGGRPVMVWLYGGGGLGGASSDPAFDGSAFARKDVILISLNYRVNRFGFFAHPELSAEARLNGESVGNYALFDQIEALRWIRSNVASFGGDPNNITVFGQSAGGRSILYLLLSHEAEGLFDKAIVQSTGTARQTREMIKNLVDSELYSQESAEMSGVSFAKMRGIGDDAALQGLRHLPQEEVSEGLTLPNLLAGLTRWQGHDTYAGGFIVDGEHVADAPYELIRRGRFSRVPMMIGSTNADTIGITVPEDFARIFDPFGDSRGEAEEVYRRQVPDVDRIGAAVATDFLMTEPTRYFAKAMAPHADVYYYRFSYRPESLRDSQEDRWKYGVPHGGDVPFVFGNPKERHPARDEVSEADQRMADIVNDYWINFARTGVPAAQGQPDWPKYRPGEELMMEFTERDGAVLAPDPWSARLDLIEGTYQDPR